MKESLTLKSLLAVVLVITLLSPIPAVACGGGGGGGGEGEGFGAASSRVVVPAIFDVDGDVIDLSGFPGFQTLTAMERQRIQERINTTLVSIYWVDAAQARVKEGVAGVADFTGRIAQVAIAFSPIGLTVKAALAGARGGADAYAEAMESGTQDITKEIMHGTLMGGGLEVATSPLAPEVGILVSEATQQVISRNHGRNRAPYVSFSDAVRHDPFGHGARARERAFGIPREAGDPFGDVSLSAPVFP